METFPEKSGIFWVLLSGRDSISDSSSGTGKEIWSRCTYIVGWLTNHVIIKCLYKFLRASCQNLPNRIRDFLYYYIYINIINWLMFWCISLCFPVLNTEFLDPWGDTFLYRINKLEISNIWTKHWHFMFVRYFKKIENLYKIHRSNFMETFYLFRARNT